jgi:uncharacterized repeat protein (TIGR01451 family)
MLRNDWRKTHKRAIWRSFALALSAMGAVLAALGLLGLMTSQSVAGHAASTDERTAVSAPIPPPEGYPKLNLSTKTVTPTLAEQGGAVLYYTIEIRNTGAATATNATLVDTLPPEVAYNGDGWASDDSTLGFDGETLSWSGEVGFDTTVVVTFSVTVDAGFAGTLSNAAVVDDPGIARPVPLTAEAVITDDPILSLRKTSSPEKPGASRPLVYELELTNLGQPAVDLPVTVTDPVPADTSLREIGADGHTDALSEVVTWNRSINLELGQSTFFTFSVDVADVPSGTVISNEGYRVTPYGAGPGEPYTVTVVAPVLSLAKHVWPDPPGSNREMTFTLVVLNQGSTATDLVVTDRVPKGVSYVRGGSKSGGVVSWSWERLDTDESAEFTYTVRVPDVMNVSIINADYEVCSAERVCASGDPLTKVVQGPVFETFAQVAPIAKKPGGEEVTPTLRVHNVGNGNAVGATAVLTFYRMSLTDEDVVAHLPDGSSERLERGPDCGDKCRTFPWTGNIGHDEWVTFTVPGGISTIGGEEGVPYIATVIISDALSNGTTPTATSQARGQITHFASLVPYKSAPPVAGRGTVMTYTIEVINHAFTTDLSPVLTDVIPSNTTFVSASDGGALSALGDGEFVSWTLPVMSTGEALVRTFSVRLDSDLVSGTQIVNREYSVFGYGNILTDAVTSGASVTTTVREVGLIDSFKIVSPQISLPAPDNVLTYEIHLVNSSPQRLRGVRAHDVLPWQASTYQRDGVASAGELVSDIVSLDWRGSIGPFSEEILTATVLVDADFKGVLTNTVVIHHSSLLTPVERFALAYVTDEPVLFIHKTASPDPVRRGERLTYQLRVRNMGQGATKLAISDVLPANVVYVPDSASGDGWLDGDTMRWEWPVLASAGEIVASFQVTVGQGTQVINELFGVSSDQGIAAVGQPVVTPIKGWQVYLPLALRSNP